MTFAKIGLVAVPSVPCGRAESEDRSGGTIPSMSNQSDLQQAIQHWSGGNQDAAINLLRPLADSNDPAALGLICWFYHQMGGRIAEGIPYLEKAIDAGLPHVVGYFYGNMMNDPALRPRVPELVRRAVSEGYPVDSTGMAVQAFQQGDPAIAVELVRCMAEPRMPVPPGGEATVAELTKHLRDARRVRREIADHKTAIGQQRNTIETQTKHLTKLIQEALNAQAGELFDKEAAANRSVSSKMWKGGMWVLSAAAAVAVLPIVLYYITGDFIEKGALIYAHFGPAIALGAVSGVLLGKARGHDRAAQKARALSVALGTMFSYSGSIVDEAERQRFIHEMGRVVIEAFLRQDGPAGDGDGRSLLDALRAN